MGKLTFVENLHLMFSLRHKEIILFSITDSLIAQSNDSYLFQDPRVFESVLFYLQALLWIL